MQPLQIAVPHSIPLCMCLFKMLRAVQFYYQLGSGRIKIHDITAKRFLTVKLRAINLLAPQFRPQGLLGIGHALPQSASMYLEATVVLNRHFFFPPKYASQPGCSFMPGYFFITSNCGEVCCASSAAAGYMRTRTSYQAACPVT